MGLSVRQEIRVGLKQDFGETVGDIPMYSMHRIRRLMASEPPALGEELRTSLIRALVEANLTYQEESGRKWACLTSNNLVAALEAFGQVIETTVNQAAAMPYEHGAAKRAMLALLRSKQQGAVTGVKHWFEERSDRLFYDTSGSVPWKVVMRLRADFCRWVAGAANPFGADVEDAILDIARENGISAASPEDAWARMGGKRFTK